MSTFKNCRECVEDLVKRSADIKGTPDSALKYSQAALNAIHAVENLNKISSKVYLVFSKDTSLKYYESIMSVELDKSTAIAVSRPHRWVVLEYDFVEKKFTEV